jgi:hypothetical protein
MTSLDSKACSCTSLPYVLSKLISQIKLITDEGCKVGTDAIYYIKCDPIELQRYTSYSEVSLDYLVLIQASIRHTVILCVMDKTLTGIVLAHRFLFICLELVRALFLLLF